MSDFKDHLITEKSELDEKHTKLYTFLGSEESNKIYPVQASLLRIQLQAMATYSLCLAERISWLNK